MSQVPNRRPPTASEAGSVPNLSNLKDCPLPEGWDVGFDFDGKPYFIDHKNKTTTWVDPRDNLTKPADFTECVGDELPVGWEQAYDYHRGGIYYIDHLNQRTQETDPRSEWRSLQEEMLRSYLASAENDLKAKQELIDVKHQRLSLAQEEYSHLSNTLSNLSASSTSLNSTCSTGSKYDVEFLRADVGQCKARVQKLKRELAKVTSEVSIQQKGMETLARVKDKYSTESEAQGLTLEEARAIKAELNNIQKSLTVGEQEKIELMKNLACLKDDLTRLQHSDSTLDVSKQSQLTERLSTASQTDLSGELMPVGARLAEMARIRLQYDETRQQVQDIQQSLASLEEKIDPGQLESDKDRLLLIQEKEQLLRELRSISPRTRTLQEMDRIKTQCESLEQDLNQAMETSNRCIADRLRIHETKQMLLQQLTEAMRAMTQLESQLKLLSASTLSMSSSSSLGSLSSSHASSKGSLSSLSFTDIYGLSTTNTNNLPVPPTTESVKYQTQQTQMSSSQQSLSSHGSLSSLSPPVTPMESGYPPTYNRQIRLSTIDESNMDYLLGKSGNCSQDSGAPLSPTTIEPPPSSQTQQRVMSSAVSSESVAGDSGVFEATSPTKHLQGGDAEKLTSLMAAMSFEAAQVQIKMRYDKQDSLLHIGLERARNLRTLVLKPNRQLFLKVSLVPSVSPTNWSFTTKSVNTTNATTNEVPIGDTFPVAVPKAKLSTKTLQVTIWTCDPSETCVGSAQISLADFDWETVSVRWYNVLGLQFSMLKHSTLKSESSDDSSTIISSSASTLTKNQSELEIFSDAEIVIPSEPPAFLYKNQQTNTDSLFQTCQQQPSVRPKVKEVVKRSKTFSPKDCAQDKYSSVKLNRSDSDGAMPLYRKLPFQQRMNERRSLRLPTKLNLSPKTLSPKKEEKDQDALATKLQLKRSRRLARTKEHMMETPLDLELDLAAQKSKLDLLQSDIARLKDIQAKLEDAKAQGGCQDAGWLQDHEYLESLLSKIDQLQSKSKEERQLEKMIKKTGREIHRLRKAKLGMGELDKHMFAEKMAFLTTSKCQVPPLFSDTEISSRSSTLKHDTTLVCPPETSNSSSTSSSTCSTPTPHLKSEQNRFSYEIDPDIGVIV